MALVSMIELLEKAQNEHYAVGAFDPRKMLGPAREAATAIIREKIRVFGSNGKA